MNANERRNSIREYLKDKKEPVSASALAEHFNVSRQIIVGDIALLRAGGINIDATPRGYLLKRSPSSGMIKRIAVRHSGDQTERELNICIDNGCSVLDVIVEHPLYGQLTGSLQLSSRYDIRQFMEKLSKSDTHSLSELTDNIHLHTLKCPSEEAFKRVTDELQAEGILFQQPL